MKQYVIASDEQLKSILLNHRYPKGNIHRLLEHTVMAVRIGSISLCTHLTEDDWAFTNKEEPKPRYQLRENKEDVFDSTTGTTLGFFTIPQNAKDYMDFLNDRLGTS